VHFLQERAAAKLADADMDGDGRSDLAIISQQALPEATETLRIYQNQLSERGNWIAFSFREEPGHISPIGATVTLRVGAFEKVAAVVTGGSFRSQHPLRAAFGLGAAAKVESLGIQWPGGTVTRLTGPSIKINQTHWINAPER